MAGYIAITTSDWVNSVKVNGVSSAVFWCKKKSFVAISPGERFYFLERGKFTSSADRYIVGRGDFCRFELINASHAWEIYGNQLGLDSKQSFQEQIRTIYHDDSFDLGCIILDQIVFYKEKVSLAACGIDFSPYIVSGKKLDVEECRRIDSKTEE